MTNLRGRPRASTKSVSGFGTQEDLLRSAAQLFCEVGYSNTSTRAIADAAGVRQASIYHYFATKQDMLLVLLLQTVAPTLTTAERLLSTQAPAATKLWALCFRDAKLLMQNEFNLGSLYLLPELNDPALADFHAQRQKLRGAYHSLVSQIEGQRVAEAGRSTDLVLALVESVIIQRRENRELDAIDLAPRIADAALRVLELSSEAILSARTQGVLLAN
ncbi:MAG: hypothetical protein RL196_5 [Actinomycetota bacterium]|jgi:AcrR family transcriptional regulator